MDYKYCCVVDQNGDYVEFVLVYLKPDQDGEITEDIESYELREGEYLVDAPPPLPPAHAGLPGFLKARWNGAEWEESATPEEITAWEEEHPAPPPEEPSQIQILEAENRLLKAQVQAQSDRADFMEDCIAEMAVQVYNV